MKQPILTHVVRGSGSPVLLLNGGMMSIAAWGELATVLMAEHTVICCDFRGQLLSPGQVPATLDGHATDLEALLDHLDVGGVHIVGTSFGALVGVVFAASRPGRARSLSLIAATERVTPQTWAGAEELREACRRATSGGDGALLFDLMLPVTFSEAFRQRCAAQLEARRAMFATLPASWFAGLSALLGALQDLDLRRLLPMVDCPALILAGEHDRTFPPAHSEALRAGLRHARLEIVAGAAHALVVEEPELVARMVGGFVRTIEAAP